MPLYSVTLIATGDGEEPDEEYGMPVLVEADVPIHAIEVVNARWETRAMPNEIYRIDELQVTDGWDITWGGDFDA